MPDFTNASQRVKIAASIAAPLACIALISGAIFIAQGFLPAGCTLLACGSVAFVVDTLVLGSLFYKKKAIYEKVRALQENSDTPQNLMIEVPHDQIIDHMLTVPQEHPTENPEISQLLMIEAPPPAVLDTESFGLERLFENQYLCAFFLDYLSLQDHEILGLTNKVLNQQIENVQLGLAKKEGFQGDGIAVARNYLYNQTYIALLKILDPVGLQQLEDEVLNIHTTNKQALKHRSQLIKTIPSQIQEILAEGYCTSYSESINQLVKIGARVDALNMRSLDGRTPLHLAVEVGATIAVSNLIKFGANVHVTDKKGRTPFHLAVKFNRFECIESLVRHGARVNSKDLAGQTVLHYVISGLRKSVGALSIGARELQINKLLELGADLNIQDNDGNAPLHLITSSKFSILGFKWLQHLFNRMDLNLKNNSGNTPLHLAIARFPDNFDYAICLIEKGAEVNALNNEGETPLEKVMSLRKIAQPEDEPLLSALADRLTRQ